MLRKLVFVFIALAAAGGVVLSLLTIPLQRRLPKQSRVSMDGITTLDDAVQACSEPTCTAGILSHMRRTSLPENSPTPGSTPGIRLPGPLNEVWGTASSRRLR
jgi:hypothetical protein